MFFCGSAFSQDYLRYDKKGAKWELNNWIRKEKIKNYNWIETDSSLTLQLLDSAMAKEDLYLHFNSKGLCDEVKTFAYNCVKCLMLDIKNFKNALKYSFTEVDSTFYYSNASRRVTVRVEPSKVDSSGVLILKKFQGSKKEYKKYIEQFKPSKK
jgi:hypothetical protein